MAMRRLAPFLLLTLGSCDDPGLDEGQYGRLSFGGAPVSADLFGDRGVKPTAIGGVQTLRVYDADSEEPYGIGSADVGEHLELGPIDRHRVEVRGVTAGGSRLRIWEGDEVIDAIAIRAATIASIDVGPRVGINDPFDVDGRLLYVGGDARLVARLDAVDGETVVDEAMRFDATVGSERLRWDVLRIPDVPEGSFDVTLEAGDQPPQTFTMASTATIDEVVVWTFGQEIVCANARSGDAQVAGVPWELEIQGATVVDDWALGFDGCVELEIEAPATVTVTATEPGGLTATVSYEVTASE
jgi:hypothetical protein